MTVISISIEDELNEEIREDCAKEGRTVSGLISWLLKKYLEKQP